MKFFNAKFKLTNVNPLSDDSEFEFTGDIIDNSSMFYATDANVGDIIYLNGMSFGKFLLRYKIIEIVDATGFTLTVKAKWDMLDEKVEMPFPYIDGIIGAGIKDSELSIITNVNLNGADESLVSAARSYEQSLLVKETQKNLTTVESKIKIPTIGYSLL